MCFLMFGVISKKDSLTPEDEFTPCWSSKGKLHLVDLAGSECAKKGGLIYPEAQRALAYTLLFLVIRTPTLSADRTFT